VVIIVINPTEAVACLQENKETLLRVDVSGINRSELEGLTDALSQNTSLTWLQFLNCNFNADDLQRIVNVFEHNTSLQTLAGIESYEITELLKRNRYLAEKKAFEDMLNANDRAGEVARRFCPEYEHCFRQIGQQIVNHIEGLKEGNPSQIEILTKTLTKVSNFVKYKSEVISIDNFLKELKAKIKADEYKQLMAKICIFMGLGIILASIAAIAFSVITGNAVLVPIAAISLSFVGPLFAGIGMVIDGHGVGKAAEDGQSMHYFFTNTTPEREDDRQVLEILEPFAFSTC
jgi:putative cofactor-binding repeat protein